MKSQKTAQGYLLSIEPGEDIIATLNVFAVEEKIPAGTFSAIGAVLGVELGYYELSEKQYHWKVFEGTIEIVSATGNIAWLDGSPIVHMHGVFSGTDFIAFGGHVRRAVVSAACEVVLVVHDDKLIRSHDDVTGLNLWNIEN